jgi:hypothetical protein
MSDAIVSQGFKFEIRTGTGPDVYKEVKEIKKFSGLDGKSSILDVTHLQSTAKEKRKGLKDQGGFNITVNHLPADDGQNAMRSARDSDDPQHFKITWSDTSTTEFDGFVMSNPREGGVDAIVGGSFDIEITGDLDEEAAS